MSSHSRWARLWILASLAVPLAACAPIRVNSYVERGADLSRYRTFDFAPADSVSTGDPRLDNNPFFNERLQTAVDAQLAARGYERTVSRPDLYVHFHTSVSQEVNVNEIDRRSGYCGEEDCTPFVYDAGTLLVDLVDAGTNKLVWRGWAQTSMEGVVDNQTWMERKIDTAIERIVAKMPRRS